MMPHMVQDQDAPCPNKHVSVKSEIDGMTEGKGKSDQIQKQPLGVRRICSLSSLTSKLGCSSSEDDKQHTTYRARCHLPFAQLVTSLN